MNRAQIEAIDTIASRTPDGTLQAELVVQDARNPTSVLHSEFNWDDAKMAHQARLDQARRMIRNVRVIIERGELAYKEIVYIKNPLRSLQEPGYSAVQTMTVHSTRIAALDAEIARIIHAVGRGRRIARQFGLEAEFEDMIAAAITK